MKDNKPINIEVAQTCIVCKKVFSMGIEKVIPESEGNITIEASKKLRICSDCKAAHFPTLDPNQPSTEDFNDIYRLLTDPAYRNQKRYEASEKYIQESDFLIGRNKQPYGYSMFIHHRLCGFTSWHPEDIKKIYCAKCDLFLNKD